MLLILTGLLGLLSNGCSLRWLVALLLFSSLWLVLRLSGHGDKVDVFYLLWLFNLSCSADQISES